MGTKVALWPAENLFTSADVNNMVERILRDGRIEFFIKIHTNSKYRRLKSFEYSGYLVCRAAVDYNVPILTKIKCAKQFPKVLYMIHSIGGPQALPLGSHDLRYSSTVIILPWLILIGAKASLDDASSIATVACDSIHGGFVTSCSALVKMSATLSRASRTLWTLEPVNQNAIIVCI